MRRIQAQRRVLTAYAPLRPRAWREPYGKRNARRLAVRKLKARLDDGRRFLLFCWKRPDWLLWWVEVGMLAATEIMMLAALCDAFMSIGITRKTLFLFVSAGNLAAASMFWWCFKPDEKPRDCCMFWWCFKPDEKPRDCCTRGLLWLMLPVCGLFAVIFFRLFTRYFWWLST